jgi:hypothetical protein
VSSNNYKECVPSDNPDYFDGVVRPSGVRAIRLYLVVADVLAK